MNHHDSTAQTGWWPMLWAVAGQSLRYVSPHPYRFEQSGMGGGSKALSLSSFPSVVAVRQGLSRMPLTRPSWPKPETSDIGTSSGKRNSTLEAVCQ